ncbi:hypothetical protein DPMN_029681 [Dreissena polymorpha]|uniref:Uncharacterized protein n=1 Tax=Dreissena polymorpha TaxID=45954 RepID=A0A9D4LZ45_DREPO|nr:hypothetical protein DPMN_029681 [Dreissena polymorpha]
MMQLTGMNQLAHFYNLGYCETFRDLIADWRLQGKTITVEDNTILVSPGPSRFANAGRPARTGMILTLFPGAAPVDAGKQPGKVPVNPDWLRFIPVKPRQSPGSGSCPGESRQRPGRAPVYRNTAGTHRVYTGIRPRQNYGNAPVSPRSSPVMPRRSPGECRWPLPGFVWLFPVPSRLLPVPRRSFPVVPGPSRFIPEFTPVVPDGAPVHPGRARITHRGSVGIIFFEELRQTLGIGDPGLTVSVIHYENVIETIAYKDHFKMHKIESRASFNIYVVAALNT